MAGRASVVAFAVALTNAPAPPLTHDRPSPARGAGDAAAPELEPTAIEPTAIEPTAIEPTALPAKPRIDRLLLRAEARQLAGDAKGALTLLADAMELTATSQVPARTEADVLLAVHSAHQSLANDGESAHARVAAEVRERLLDDRERLELTADELAALQPPEPSSPNAPSPRNAGTTAAEHTSVAEKVLEAKVLTTRKMISAGTTMFTVGVGFSMGGIVLLAFADATEKSLDEYKVPDQEDERHAAIRDGSAQNGGGIALVSLGGVLVVSGIVLLSVGVSRTRAQLGKSKRSKKRVAVEAMPGLGTIGMRF